MIPLLIAVMVVCVGCNDAPRVADKIQKYALDNQVTCEKFRVRCGGYSVNGVYYKCQESYWCSDSTRHEEYTNSFKTSMFDDYAL